MIQWGRERYKAFAIIQHDRIMFGKWLKIVKNQKDAKLPSLFPPFLNKVYRLRLRKSKCTYKPFLLNDQNKHLNNYKRPVEISGPSIDCLCDCVGLRDVRCKKES